MDAISLNHAQIFTTTTKIQPSNDTPTAPEETVFTASNSSASNNQPSNNPPSNNQPSVIVTLSAEASQFSQEYNFTSRFSSMEEQSEHKTRLAATWVTLEELENGTRRPFASAEDERLSYLTLKELMGEGQKLPNVDANGHLKSSFGGTEQGDRIGVAVANLSFETQYNYKKAAKNVEASVEKFKQHTEEKFNIDPESYDIIFRDGKVTAVSKGKDGADDATLKKIQRMLDNPEKIKAADTLTQDIEAFNKAAWQLVDHPLTIQIYGAQQNRYLPKEVSVDWLMEGMNYSHASVSGQIHDKYLSIIAEANEKYHAALKDGSHLANSTTDKGIMELTRLRQLQNQNP